jgi:hypothetical protein
MALAGDTFLSMIGYKAMLYLVVPLGSHMLLKNNFKYLFCMKF